jgi:DNA mismatch repair ATPase MutS
MSPFCAVACVQVVGVGFVDTTERKLSVCEFPDDQHFSNLEALIVQLGPKEVLLPVTPESSVDMAEVKKVRHPRYSMMAMERPYESNKSVLNKHQR